MSRDLTGHVYLVKLAGLVAHRRGLIKSPTLNEENITYAYFFLCNAVLMDEFTEQELMLADGYLENLSYEDVSALADGTNFDVIQTAPRSVARLIHALYQFNSQRTH